MTSLADSGAGNFAFAEALRIAPDDGPSRTMLRRLDQIEADPPTEDWDGSWNVAK